jgi:hypothetical protein
MTHDAADETLAAVGEKDEVVTPDARFDGDFTPPVAG